MAFEAFLAQDQARPKKRRRVTYTVSLLLHGVLLAVGVAYSFWHVEELSPPTVRVTFMTAAPPPPPPPPPPAAGGGAKKKIALKPKIVPTVVQPKPNAIVQPKEAPKKETPKEDPKEEDDDEVPGGVIGGTKGGVIGGTVGGTVGGTIGGTVGGTIGGTPSADAAPKLLPPHMGALQKQPGSADPAFPPNLRKPGMVYVVMAKICVNKAGSVDSVTIMKKADPLLDNNVATTVKTWRFRPLLANNTPVPFCYFGRFEFKSD